ncbi:acyl-CoA thioesterase [Pseudogulbenkiania subflava]|uniref:Acyl-CoA thioester hydrolase n=1 Tax=Pseudogulbenkiania subflava DSM 22618 TaxID=1123014 RepID=A0A1Y6BKW2_9NEIS|nr:thioesterase family protein [Pseudogulbenkiania subflava]SMF15616.1 acyl-CoA thioester hydrolase [Pseudogulbenkiania subflava DSM 22618]
MENRFPVIDRRTIAMRWGDMDAVGHLNNTNYFRYLEQIRIEWLDELGHGINPDGIGPVLASTSCVYRKELVYPATVVVTIELEKLGNSSLKLRHRFFRDDDDETVYAEAEAALVWVDYRSGQTVRIPEPIRAAISGEGVAT